MCKRHGRTQKAMLDIEDAFVEEAKGRGVVSKSREGKRKMKGERRKKERKKKKKQEKEKEEWKWKAIKSNKARV